MKAISTAMLTFFLLSLLLTIAESKSKPFIGGGGFGGGFGGIGIPVGHYHRPYFPRPYFPPPPPPILPYYGGYRPYYGEYRRPRIAGGGIAGFAVGGVVGGVGGYGR